MKLTLALLAFLGWQQMGFGQPSQNYFPHYALFNINNISSYVRNGGRLHNNPLTGNAGFEWPNGSRNTAIYASGLWLAAKIRDSARTAMAEYTSDFNPGAINATTHEASDPNDPRFRVYKIHAGDSTSWDYVHWPSEFGAPTTELGRPKLLGEQTLWCVYNDVSKTESERLMFGSKPLGVEVQQTVFGYNSLGSFFKNLQMIRYLIINKGVNTLDSMYFGFWSDPDIGNLGNDRDGCDSTLSLWFCYVATDSDPLYGLHPPAVGYITLEGPRIRSTGDTALYMGQRLPGYKNLPMTGFVYWENAGNTNPRSATAVYQYFQSRWPWGQPITYGGFGRDSLAPRTHFMYTGDPETGVGWLSTSSRHEFGSSGVFTMAPGDTQEVVIGILVSRGTSNTNSVTNLKNETRALYSSYRDSLYTFFVPANPYIPPPEPPVLPTRYELFQNYPNPFNPGTEIQFDLPRGERVTLAVYNILGQRMATLASGFHEAGTYTVRWEAGSAASGVYLYRLDAGRYVRSRRMLLLR